MARTHVLHRLGVRSNWAVRVNTGFRATGPRFRKSPVIRHRFRRLHGLTGTGASFQTPQARAASKARATAKAKAKADAHTALLRSPERRALLRQAALQKAAANRSPARKALRQGKPRKASRPKAPKRPAKPKTASSGAPISAANYLNMF